MSVVNRIYRTFVCSCSPALVPGDVSRCPPFKLKTRAHIPNLSNDLEKRLFLMAIKDTITVPNHSPWGCIESYQWLWQLSITRGVYQSFLEGIYPVRHLDIFWPVPLVHHNGGFIVMPCCVSCAVRYTCVRRGIYWCKYLRPTVLAVEMYTIRLIYILTT